MKESCSLRSIGGGGGKEPTTDQNYKTLLISITVGRDSLEEPLISHPLLPLEIYRVEAFWISSESLFTLRISSNRLLSASL